MPRDGSNIYHRPPGTDAVPDTTIESTKYNSNVADVEQDLNLPRPIVAGGTGANNAHDAMIALSGEIAGQVVTNYDSFPFVAGSFYNNPGATSAPTASSFIGICYVHGAPGYMTLEAREVLGAGIGRVYVRQKLSGTWSSWEIQPGSVAEADATYVNVAGDTMTGPLNGTDVNASGSLRTGVAATNTGYVVFGSDNTHYLQSAGATGFNLQGAGGLHVTDTTASSSPTTGALTVAGGVGVSGAIISGGNHTAGGGGTTGTYYFGNSGTKSLNYDGTNFNLAGGNFNLGTGGAIDAPGDIVSHNNIRCMSTATTGYYHFGNTGTKYLNYDGTNFNLVGGGLNCIAFNATRQDNSYQYTLSGAARTWGIAVLSNGSLDIDDISAGQQRWSITTGGQVSNGVGTFCRNGLSGGYSANIFNFFYNAGLTALWIDNTNFGNITTTSDYRIKKDVIDLPGMWDTVKALRPIKYTQAQFSPPSHVKYIAEETIRARKEAEENPEAKPREVNTAPLFPADDIERWGFIAHELQATLTPSAATGVKDAPDTIQSPNPFTLIAALTKALQEAMARIEALEAK